MTMLFTVRREAESAAILSHQFLEPLERHDLPERNVDSVGPRLHPKDRFRFVRQIGVQPD